MFTVSSLLAVVAFLMRIMSLGGSGSCSVLTGRHDGYPSIIRACFPALVLWDSASMTFINRLQIIPNKAAEVPRLHHRDLEWHTLWKTWCIIMPMLFPDKKLLLLLGPQARCFFWSCTSQLEVWTAALYVNMTQLSKLGAVTALDSRCYSNTSATVSALVLSFLTYLMHNQV